MKKTTCKSKKLPYTKELYPTIVTYIQVSLNFNEYRAKLCISCVCPTNGFEDHRAANDGGKGEIRAQVVKATLKSEIQFEFL